MPSCAKEIRGFQGNLGYKLTKTMLRVTIYCDRNL